MPVQTHFELERKNYSDLRPGEQYLSRVFGAGIVVSEVMQITGQLPYNGVKMRCRRIVAKHRDNEPVFETFNVEAHGEATVIRAFAQ